MRFDSTFQAGARFARFHRSREWDTCQAGFPAVQLACHIETATPAGRVCKNCFRCAPPANRLPACQQHSRGDRTSRCRRSSRATRGTLLGARRGSHDCRWPAAGRERLSCRPFVLGGFRLGSHRRTIVDTEGFPNAVTSLLLRGGARQLAVYRTVVAGIWGEAFKRIRGQAGTGLRRRRDRE